MLSSHPTPPQPQLLRSIEHVFMCNECYHPIPPHPNPNCCVASNMCSCATNVNTSHPTPPQPRMTIYVTGAQENARFAAFPLGETRLRARRYVRPEPKTNGVSIKKTEDQPTQTYGMSICEKLILSQETPFRWNSQSKILTSGRNLYYI